MKGVALKNFATYVVAIFMFCTLNSCAGNMPATPLPTNNSTSSPTIVAAISMPNMTLDDFQDKIFVGEDDNYSVYLINRTGGTDAAPTGELLVFSKSTNQVIKMSGLFTVIIEGGTIVFDDGMGKYVLLSIGTYTSRDGVVLSLDDQKQAVNRFCMSSGQYYPNEDHLFWNDYIIINNCDTFSNRPWGMGEALSVTTINLITGTETVIAKSDLTHQYSVKQVEGNTLRYGETYVENGADWQHQDKQKTDDKTYDLTLLGNH